MTDDGGGVIMWLLRGSSLPRVLTVKFYSSPAKNHSFCRIKSFTSHRDPPPPPLQNDTTYDCDSLSPPSCSCISRR